MITTAQCLPGYRRDSAPIGRRVPTSGRSASTVGDRRVEATEVPYTQADLGDRAIGGARPLPPPSAGVAAGTSHHGIGNATGLSRGNGAAGADASIMRCRVLLSAPL